MEIMQNIQILSPLKTNKNFKYAYRTTQVIMNKRLILAYSKN